MRYTLRNVPEELDRALRALANRQHKSLNEVVIAALLRAVVLDTDGPIRRDLSDIAGSWQEVDEFDQVLAEQQRIDRSMWPVASKG